MVVNGGHEETVAAAARAVANSPLVKAALHGGDRLLVPAVQPRAADALGALAVAHDQQREPAQDGVERLAEAQLVLGAQARSGQTDAPVAIRIAVSLVEELAVDRDAVERALHADAEQQVGGLRREPRVALHEHSIVAKLGRSSRALGLGGDADRARQGA